MAHDNCMYGALTQQEQARAADWIVRTMRARPDDFVFHEIPGLIIDQRSMITINLIDGADYVHIGAYKTTIPLLGLIEGSYARAIKEEAHRLRHRNGNPASKAIDAAMAAHPAQGAPAIDVGLDQFFARYERLEATTPWIGSDTGAITPAVHVPPDKPFARYSLPEATMPFEWPAPGDVTWIGSDPANGEDRTEPEVAKLRRLVEGVMKNPVGALAIAAAIITVLTGIGQALAG